MLRSTAPAQYGRSGVVVCLWIGASSQARKAAVFSHSDSRM
jgi:hypothetical protein